MKNRIGLGLISLLFTGFIPANTMVQDALGEEVEGCPLGKAR